MTALKELRARWMADAAFRAEYDALEEEFALAEALIVARDKAGLTREQVARLMETSKAYVARMEGSMGNPSVATLRRFAKATGTRLKITFEPQDTRPVGNADHDQVELRRDQF